eukprot:TRINITY_DN2617_c0_g1_i2.p2 TRINITY_DN2617_c0_g1~~TRINITY_DN2617_c0_g1_i2.p2  ORF type:complete len:131 (-),score=43.97 TRINITY_DN2617_c0_g1_i2:79-471(-)
MSKEGVTPENLREDPKETIFAKIIAGQIPSKKVYEDDHVFAFHDISPAAPVHILVLPKKPLGGIGEASDDDEQSLGRVMIAASKIAKQEGFADDGYRLVINQGKHGQQSVHYLHVHIIGGKQLSWPPGCQ